MNNNIQENPFQMNNQIWMNMMNNNNLNNNMFNFNPNFMNNMNQMPNQINPLMNMNKMNMNEQMIIMNLNQRIIELENIIKKKDIQIAKLKEKLAKSNSFDYIYSPNMDELDDEDESKVYKDLELIIRFNPPEKSKDKFVFHEYCNFNERIKSIKKRLFKKISEKFNVKLHHLKIVFNCYELRDELKASEAGLTNGSNIFIIDTSNIRGAGNDNKLDKKNEYNENNTIDNSEDKIRLTLKTMNGNAIYIFANKEVPIGIVLIYYFLKSEKLYELIDFINGNKQFVFVFNASPLNIKDRKSLKEIFGNTKDPLILVNDIHNLIGG